MALGAAALLASAAVWACTVAVREPERHARGMYRVMQRDGIWWYVSPGGKPVFSLGVCCVGMGTSPEEYSDDRPSYSGGRHYATSREWARATASRLRHWGFSTIGGWSDYERFIEAGEVALPISPVLHAGSTAGIPWLDLWDPAVLARVDETARLGIAAVSDKAPILGYYADNELGWWNHVLVDMTLKMPPESAQRRRVLALLRRHYGGDWRRLLADFDPEGAESFEELDRRGTLYLRPGGGGARVERRILGLLAERYYRVTTAAIRKYAGKALVLGDRYQSFYYPEVVRAARRHVDVISTNLNAHWIDGTFAQYYLRTLHELSGKPVQIGEFYMCASQNRSGNPNSSAGFPVVETQAERAAGFRNTVSQAVGIPFVVGADWFQYYDEPPHGRGDGEDYNMGLVDIRDVPYEEITDAARSLDLHALHSQAHVAPRSANCVPRAAGDPLRDFTYLRALVSWDRVAGYIEPSTRHAVADLYACWRPEALYLGLHSMGFLEAAAYRAGEVPECDRSLWTIRFGSPSRTVHIRFGSGRTPVSSSADVRVVASEPTKDHIRSVVAVVLPASLFRVRELTAGMSITLDAALDTAGRCDHVRWRRTLVLD